MLHSVQKSMTMRHIQNVCSTRGKCFFFPILNRIKCVRYRFGSHFHGTLYWRGRDILFSQRYHKIIRATKLSNTHILRNLKTRDYGFQNIICSQEFKYRTGSTEFSVLSLYGVISYELYNTLVLDNFRQYVKGASKKTLVLNEIII